MSKPAPKPAAEAAKGALEVAGRSAPAAGPIRSSISTGAS